MRRLVFWLLIVLVISAGVAAVAYPARTWWEERNAPKYLTATVSCGRVETVVNSTGTVKPVRTVSVGAFTSGPIKEVTIDFNSEITKISETEWQVTGPKSGPVKWLALIDDKLQTAAVDRDKALVASQEAELQRVEALLDQALIKKDRGDKLMKINLEFISATELDDLRFAVKVLEAQRDLTKASIRQAKANLRNSEDQLRYTMILPPEEINAAKGVKGKVIDRKVDPGQTVVGTFQTAEMFTIALEMDKHLHVYASVDEADIGMIRAATERKQMVSFTVDAYPGVRFDGTIHDIRLNSTTTQNVVTYPVIIDAPNKDQKLKPGMTANITFQVEAKDDVLRVPASALRYTPLPALVHPDDKHYLEAITNAQTVTGAKRSATEKADIAQSRQNRIVWVREGKLLRAVPITLGLIEHRHAELIKGDLSDGQEVVTGVEGALAPR